jgi:iron complex transport system substrate-binding protein
MFRPIKNRISYFAVFFLFGIFSAPLPAREITDMYGKRVVVPDNIARVFSISPSVTYLIYAIDPDLLIALNRVTPDSEKPYLRKSFQDLPILGGAFGTGLNLNLETVLNLKPDVLVIWGGDGAYDNKTAEKIYNLNIPVVSVDIDSVSRYPETFTFLGRLFNREKRAGELADYAKKALSEVKSAVSGISAEKRLSVYISRTKDGLNTACEKSWHAELIPLAGGTNPVKCSTGEFTGMEKISMEQVMLMNPDAIVALESTFPAGVYQDERWLDIKAVKGKRVYSAPREPLNWFGGPPTFMGILGLQWLTECLYPDYYHKDIEEEARKFMRLFFNLDLSDAEIKRILG